MTETPNSWSIREITEKFFGVTQLKDQLRGIQADAVEQEKSFQIERAENDANVRHVQTAREALENQYKAAAAPLLQAIDEASWSKVVVEKAKDLLAEKSSQMDAEKSTDGVRPWSFCPMADEINSQSVLLEKFVQGWKTTGASRWTDFAGLRHAFVHANFPSPTAGEAADVLFRVAEFESAIRRQASKSRVQFSIFDTESLVNVGRDLVRRGTETLKQSVSTGKDRLTDTWRTLAGKDQLPRAFPVKAKGEKPFGGSSLAEVFPDQHWSTGGFSEIRNRFVASDAGVFDDKPDERSRIYEQLAFQELANVLRARIDIDRIHMSEFLFHGNTPDVEATVLKA